MQINTNNLVSITEANQNFSRIAKMVDASGAAVIPKNNTPPFATFGGTSICNTTQGNSAKLCFGLVKNHPFIDGNKRIGILAILSFLEEIRKFIL